MMKASRPILIVFFLCATFVPFLGAIDDEGPFCVEVKGDLIGHIRADEEAQKRVLDQRYGDNTNQSEVLRSLKEVAQKTVHKMDRLKTILLWTGSSAILICLVAFAFHKPIKEWIGGSISEKIS